MKKRWLIRSLFLLPLVCVVAAWVGSYFATFSFDKWFEGRERHMGAVQGLIHLEEGSNDGLPDTPLQIHVYSGKKITDSVAIGAKFGFYAGKFPFTRDSFMIVFPLWLPTLLLAAVNWIVWRKTRAKPIGKAFPVEPTSAQGEPPA